MPVRFTSLAANTEIKAVSMAFMECYKTRAKNQCEWCGAENYQPHPITGSKVILTVAHIDQNKANNSFFNLKALCQKCYLNHDRNQHARNRKFGRNHKKNQLTIKY